MLWVLVEALLMSTHNTGNMEKLRKLSQNYHQILRLNKSYDRCFIWASTKNKNKQRDKKPWLHKQEIMLLLEVRFILETNILLLTFLHLDVYLVGCAVRLETRRSRVQPPPRSATFFRGDWSWNIFYGHSLPSADSRRAVVSFWRKNVHNTG